MSEPVRVRIAPSPTGTVHLGLARTALFNWAWARRQRGAFVLRIEDTDRERSTAASETAIFDGLRWLGLEWDEGPDVGGPFAPYRQSERLERHRELAAQLLAEGAAYRCFCTPERLDALREEQRAQKLPIAYDRRCADLDPATAAARAAAGEPCVLRFRVPPGETSFDDVVRGTVTFQQSEVDDWIVLRTDGSPTYNFVVVCDDLDMRITLVLRGEEHIVNTPKQVLLYTALGAAAPRFGHLPLMLGADKKKLSKRTGDTSLQDYRDKGYPRAAIVNFLCLQGWALDGATEVFDSQQLIASFDPKDVSKGGSIFDLDKLQWLAGDYIRRESVAELADHCAPFMERAGLATAAELEERRAWYERLVASEQERIQLYGDLPERSAYLFAPDESVPYDAKAEKGARKHEDRDRVLAAFAAWLAERDAAGDDPAALREGARGWVAEQGLALPALFQPLRCALTGKPGGADLFDVIGLLGVDRALRRIAQARERLA